MESPPRYTVAEARALLPQLRAHVDHMVALRADLVESRLAMERGLEPPVGGLPEVKALEARLQHDVDWFADHGIQLKGIAPVIVDFPAELDDRTVLLCWLEGEAALAWYHLPELGFMGRRPLGDA